MSYLHCFPIEWDNFNQRVAKIEKRSKLFIANAVQILQIFYFGVMTVILYNQYKTGCVYKLLPNTVMWLVTIMLYLWGMGASLARKAGALLNTTIRFEEWLQGEFHEMEILAKQNGGRSITKR